jgi:membrane-associated phospholipid phosphatase
MLILLFRKKSRWIAPVVLLWASLVSYAQISVGVHYPIDILGGALLGTIISIIIYKIASRYVLPKLGPEL